MKLDEDVWLASRVRDERLTVQSVELVKRLALFDPSIFRPACKTVSRINQYGQVSVIESSRYQNRNIIPSTQQRNSRSYLKPLTRYVSTRPYTRMLVCTQGDRWTVGVEDLGAAMDSLNKILKDDLGPVFREFDCEEILRRTEFTMKRDESGKVFYHVHAHLLYTPSHRMPKRKWEGFLKAVHAVFGTRHVHDAGRLRDPREAVKYCCKFESEKAGTNGTIGLLDLDPWELYQMSKVVKGRKLLRPVGEFSEFLKRLKGDKVVLKRLQLAEDQYKWIEVERDTKRDIECKQEGKSYNGNIVLGWCVGAFHRPVIEKSLLVQDYQGDFGALLAMRCLGAEAFALPDPIKVHNTTTTAFEPVSFSSRKFLSGIPPNGDDPPKASILLQNAGHFQDNSDEK